MITFVIGLIIAAVGVILCLNYLQFAYILLFTIGIVVSVISMQTTSAGWRRGKTIEEHTLIPLIENTNIYVIYSEDGNYMYRYVDEYGKEIIKCSSIDKTFVDIEGNKEPTFVICEMKARKSLWVFPIGCSKWQNILYIPKDGLVE